MRTVRVRIAVAVDVDGRWHASGWNGLPDDSLAGMARFIGEDKQQVVHWVEADLPLPAPQTIRGEVKP